MGRRSYNAVDKPLFFRGIISLSSGRRISHVERIMGTGAESGVCERTL